MVIMSGILSQTPAAATAVQPEDLEWPSQYVVNGPSTLRVLVQGYGPAIVIVPSYGRDGGDDFNGITNTIVQAGYKVLRPQPRGMLGSTGPMVNVTIDDLASDIAAVIDQLASGRALVLGHAFGTFVTKRVALNYPSKVPAIISAAGGGQKIPTDIAGLPFIAGNTSLPLSQRLDALKKGFFAPDHDASAWLQGWNTPTLAMEHAAIEGAGDLTTFWAGANTTQVLEVIPAEDPFHPMDQWNQTELLYPDRTRNVVVPDAAHALFIENPKDVAAAIMPFIVQQAAKL
jgi:pimeloyl-ACP methyl ester carboxylesterase